MRVLVTGGGGFVGGYVVDRLLMRGYEVSSLGRSEQPELEKKGVQIYRGDLADEALVEKACKGKEAVFHVAAKAGVWGSWEGFYQANVIGSRNVISACRKQGVSHLIYTSTPSVVFNRKEIRNGDENMPYGERWLCHYAHTKAIAEREVLSAQSDTFSVAALRPHLIFGPGDPHLLPRVIQSALAGRLKVIGDGTNKVDVSYVEDVAESHLNALDALLQEKGKGQAFFISQGEPVELWPWINLILEKLGHSPLEKKVSLSVAYGVASLIEGAWNLLKRKEDPPLTRFVAVELAKDHYFSIQAAENVLGYRPSIKMDAAIEATVLDLKARGF